MATTATEIYSAVKSHYSNASSNRSATGEYESAVAKAFGYSDAELASIPQESNLGLSCGNPLVLAALRPGETILDLGSGAGFDVFLASPKVGPTGLAIGVDMNPEMLAKAEQNKLKGGYQNVKFVDAPITDIKAVESSTVDCVISNCVVNLVPEEEKHLVFKEMHRLLRPGGRVAISDILIKDGTQMPEHLKRDMGLYVGCISGASLISGYERYLKEAGFKDILIIDNVKDLNVYNSDGKGDEGSKSCCGTTVPAQEATRSCCGTSVPVQSTARSCCGTSTSVSKTEASVASINVDLKSVDFNAYAGSYNIYAVKPIQS